MSFRNPEPFLDSLLAKEELIVAPIERQSTGNLVVCQPGMRIISPAVLAYRNGLYVFERDSSHLSGDGSIHGLIWQFYATKKHHNPGDSIGFGLPLRQALGMVVVEDNDCIGRMRLERWATSGDSKIFTAVTWNTGIPLFDQIGAYIQEAKPDRLSR